LVSHAAMVPRKLGGNRETWGYLQRGRGWSVVWAVGLR